MALIKVYLLNGQHIDLEVEKSIKPMAQEIADSGCWAREREEDIFYPSHQILKVRICKKKAKA